MELPDRAMLVAFLTLVDVRPQGFHCVWESSEALDGVTVAFGKISNSLHPVVQIPERLRSG